MTLFKSAQPGEVLEHLLDREREALLSGNLDALSRLHTEKSALIDRLRKNRLPESRLEALRHKARRNLALFKAAQKGIGSVLRQLRAPTDQAGSFQTYDLNGASKKLGAPKRKTMEKRA